jgi:hypothetical protein
VSDTETNRKIVTAAFEAWRIENSSRVGGSYADKADFFDRVLTPFGARFAGSAEPFRPVDIRSVFADGDTVIVVFEGRGIARDDIAYENTYAWFLRMAEGQVLDGVAFFDGPPLDELWTRLKP